MKKLLFSLSVREKILLILLGVSILASAGFLLSQRSQQRSSRSTFPAQQLRTALDDIFDDCDICDGKVSMLTLRFDHDTDAIVKIIQSANGKDVVVYERLTEANEIFSITGLDSQGTLGPQIQLYVNDQFNAAIHTSCSIDIGPGYVAGFFTVIYGESRNNGTLCPFAPLCGDGIQDENESCDTGPDNGQICTADYGQSCTYCSSICDIITIRGPFCGDGIVNGMEQCDGDVGVGPNQTCSESCMLIDLHSCGDGTVDPDEECDDGNNTSGDGCEANCTKPDSCNDVCVSSIGCDGGFVCSGGSCRNYSCVSELDCICANCGDGNVDSGEECDDGTANGQICTPLYGQTCSYCTIDCTSQQIQGTFCGDDIVNGTEECDGDAGVGANQTCSQDCTLIDLPTCGDGNIDSGEECDDGNNTSGDGCEANCTKPDSCNDVCVSSIGCDGGFVCSGGSCRNYSCVSELDCICANCGDGNVDSGEECDDGNNTSGDGCSASCMIEDEEEEEEEEEEKEGDCEGSIGNYIWNDYDVDGIQDENEPGIARVEVCAYDGNDKFCDKTNDQGRYKIKGLCLGTYDVRVRTLDLPDYVQTFDPDSKKNNRTEVRLRGDKDHHTKADFGYVISRVAPSTGIGTIMLLVISVFLSIFTLLTFSFLKRRKSA